MPTFQLRFRENRLADWAERYDELSDNLEFEHEMVPVARRRGYLTKREFIALCEWKTVRTRPLVRRNSSAEIELVTRAALDTSRDDIKIGLLRTLYGVDWPTASVVLHFCDKRPYPILDFRALWTLGYITPPRYTFPFWMNYTKFVRGLARRSGLSMRLVDRALWQYSKERQR